MQLEDVAVRRTDAHAAVGELKRVLAGRPGVREEGLRRRSRALVAGREGGVAGRAKEYCVVQQLRVVEQHVEAAHELVGGDDVGEGEALVAVAHQGHGVVVGAQLDGGGARRALRGRAEDRRGGAQAGVLGEGAGATRGPRRDALRVGEGRRGRARRGHRAVGDADVRAVDRATAGARAGDEVVVEERIRRPVRGRRAVAGPAGARDGAAHLGVPLRAVGDAHRAGVGRRDRRVAAARGHGQQRAGRQQGSRGVMVHRSRVCTADRASRITSTRREGARAPGRGCRGIGEPTRHPRRQGSTPLSSPPSSPGSPRDCMGAANFVHGASCHLELIHASEGAALLSLCAPARVPRWFAYPRAHRRGAVAGAAPRTRATLCRCGRSKKSCRAIL